jgi:heptosyltransferase I
VDSASLKTQNFSRILLVKPTAMGDVIHTIPVLVKLRARYPGARIDWLVTPENAELVRHHPALSNAVIFGRKKFGAFGALRLMACLRAARYDLVIDLQGLFRSALFTRGTCAPVRIGFEKERADLKKSRRGWAGAREGAWLAYTDPIRIPTLDVHAIDRYLWLAPMLGLDDAPPDLRIFPGDEAEKIAAQLLTEHALEKFAVLAPGTKWETKHWPAERFANVGRELKVRGLAVCVAGSDAEKNLCTEVARACGAVDLAGKTSPGVLAAILKRTAICVSNDSGPMHLAVAMGTPVVGVFGPTNPLRVGPYRHADAVARIDLPCSPCSIRQLRNCPNKHACMNELGTPIVLEKIDTALAPKHG